MTAANHTASKRIHSLDIMKGIVLLGILIINIQTYTLFAFLRPGQVYALQLDKPDTYAPVQFLISLLIQGQFYTLYSFLFGIGFYQMWQRSERLGLCGNRVAKRRLWSLLLLGLVHAFVFWFGDVLHQYALLGFTLLYFNKKEVPVLLRWIAALVLLVFLFLIIKTIGFQASNNALMTDGGAGDNFSRQVMDTWQYGSVASVMSLQKEGVVRLWLTSAQNGFAGLVQYEIMFLLGLIAGKLNLFYRTEEVKPLGKRLLLMVLPTALFLKALSLTDGVNIHLLSVGNPAYQSLLRLLSSFVAVPLLTVAYLIFFSLFFQKKPSRFRCWIANTGRASLTNYLAQTGMCAILFYGYAFGLAGHVTLAGSFMQVVLIYALQVLFSNLWMKDHDTGPVEMLWRRIAYGRKKTLRETLIRVPVLPYSKAIKQTNHIQ